MSIQTPFEIIKEILIKSRFKVVKKDGKLYGTTDEIELVFVMRKADKLLQYYLELYSEKVADNTHSLPEIIINSVIKEINEALKNSGYTIIGQTPI